MLKFWNSLSRSQTACSRPYRGRSLRKVLTSLHHIAGTDNLQIHSTERWRYNTRDTRKRTPYTQYPFQNMLRHPRGGYLLYNGYCIYAAVLTPVRSLEIWFSFDPCVWEKNMEIVYFDPSYLSKFGKMYSFYPILVPLAFWINGRGWASLSETHQSAPTPGRHASSDRFQNTFTLTVRMGTVV